MSTTKWNIDPTHTVIGFKVKHMMFTNVKGQFDDYHTDIHFSSDDFTNAKLDFTAKINSINTNNKDRDAHLISPDFFDEAQYPELKFTSKSITGSGHNFKVTGDLKMHGVSNPVILDVEFSGEMKDPWGNTKTALNITGKISRKDWGLTYNSALETGGVLISDEVKLDIEIQLVKA